mgnify:CR=1 FL=1
MLAEPPCFLAQLFLGHSRANAVKQHPSGVFLTVAIFGATTGIWLQQTFGPPSPEFEKLACPEVVGKPALIQHAWLAPV